MKRILLLLCLLVSLAGMLRAETVFGLRGGLSNTTFIGEDVTGDLTSKRGFHLGMMLQQHLGKYVILQPELLYSQRGGYELHVTGPQQSVEVTDSYDYVELPLMLKLNLDVRGTKFRPYLGGDARYLLNAESKTVTTDGNAQTTDVTRIENASALDYGVNGGFDIVLFGDLEVGLRYNLGLVRITEDTGQGYVPDVRNSGMMLTLGFSF